MKKFLTFGCLLVALVVSGCSVLPELNQSVYEPISEPQSSVSSVDEEMFSFIVPEWLEFGMKEGEVRQHFSEEPFSYVKGSISYDIENYHGFDRNYLHFGFNESNQLYGVIYQLSSWDLNDFSSIYDKIKNEIVDFYGTPTSEDTKWIDERYKDDEYMLNEALKNGDCIYTTTWNQNDMSITLELESGTISVMYESKVVKA